MRTLLAALFVLASCSSTPNPTRDRLVALAKAVGDEVIQAEGYAFVAEHAPELVRILDANGDEVLTLAEIEAAPLREAGAVALLTRLLGEMSKR